MPRVVIVGAGQAGGRAALTLRKEECPHEIVLIGEESNPPYQRPPLSKAVLLETRTVEQGYLADTADYARRNIDLRLNSRVAGIDVENKSVTIDPGQTLDYDYLILATGAIPNRLKLPGYELDNIHVLRTAEDAVGIRSSLEPESRVAIIGGGFIGLEVAASARQRCCSVTVLEAQERLLTRSLPPAAADVAARLHEDKGVNLMVNARIESFEGNGAVTGIRLQSGKVLPVDAVIVGVGVRPDTRLAEQAELEVDDGIITDAFCRTSADSVYAVGDCARAYLGRYGRHIRLESHQNADQQGATAARHIAGKEVAYDPVPWLWSQQYDWVMQTAGFPTEGDQIVTRGSAEGGHFLSFSFDQGRLRGVAGLGRGAGVAKDVRVTQMTMDKGLTPDIRALADVDTPLKTIMQEAK